MQLANVFSASCGLKIDKPEIYDVYFPFVEKDFITIDTDKNNYTNWQDVINIIRPVLSEANIEIFSLGEPESVPIRGTLRTNGTISAGQKSYLIKKSKLHVSNNNLTAQICASLNKKLICIVDNKKRAIKFPESWSDQNNHTFIYPESGDEFIKVEKLAKAILTNLDLPCDLDYETIYVGNKYKDGSQFVEHIPTSLFDLKKYDLNSVLLRMDLGFSEENLATQLQIGKATIYTDKDLNLDILNTFKENIIELVYEVKEHNNPDFVKKALNLGIKCHLTSYLPKEKIDDLKLNYMDIGNILSQQYFSVKDLPNHELLDIDNLFYRSKKVICKNDLMYLSEASLEKGIQSHNSFDMQKVIDAPNFWKNLDAFSIFKKNN
jgi:hypothetical protein